MRNMNVGEKLYYDDSSPYYNNNPPKFKNFFTFYGHVCNGKCCIEVHVIREVYGTGAQ